MVHTASMATQPTSTSNVDGKESERLKRNDRDSLPCHWRLNLFYNYIQLNIGLIIILWKSAVAFAVSNCFQQLTTDFKAKRSMASVPSHTHTRIFNSHNLTLCALHSHKYSDYKHTSFCIQLEYGYREIERYKSNYKLSWNFKLIQIGVEHTSIRIWKICWFSKCDCWRNTWFILWSIDCDWEL